MAPPYHRHVFVCVNRREAGGHHGHHHDDPSCSERGSMELYNKLVEEIQARQLNDRIKINRTSDCLGSCATGINIVVYPEGVWYGFVRLKDIGEIVERHLSGGVPVERLLLKGTAGASCCGPEEVK